MVHRTTREGGIVTLQLSRRGSSLPNSCLGRGHPNQRKLGTFPKAVSIQHVLPAFQVARAQASKPQRGPGKLPATLLAKVVIIITPASKLLFLRGVLGWSGCGKASVSHCPIISNNKPAQSQSLLRSPEKIKSLPGTTLPDYPFCAQETPCVYLLFKQIKFIYQLFKLQGLAMASRIRGRTRLHPGAGI